MKRKHMTHDRNTAVLWYERQLLHVVLICLVACVFFGGTKNNGIALDDVMVLSENSFVQHGFAGIPDIFSHDSFYGATHHPASQLGWRYRPLSVAVFAAVHPFFGRNWSLYHLLNVAFYALACIAAYRFLGKWVFKKASLAFITTLFFLIHPVHCEVVANIKSLDEVLAFLFSALTLDQVLSYSAHRKKTDLFLAGIWFSLALFSKESSVLVAALVPLLLYVKSDKPFSKCLSATLPFVLLTLFFVAMRLNVSSIPDTAPGITTDPYFFASWTQKLATVTLVFGKYLLLMVYPHTLIFDYGYNHIPYVSFTDIRTLLSLLLNAVLLSYGFWSCYKRQFTGFFLLAYFSGLLLLSNLFLNVGPIMAERFLFTPGFFLLAASVAGLSPVLEKAVKPQPSLLFGVLLILCLPFAYDKVVARDAEWKDNSTLYRADLSKAPDSFRILAFNGIETVSGVSGNVDTSASNSAYRTAIHYFTRAHAIYPDYKNMYKEWGYAYLRLDLLDSAEWAWNRFKELSPDSRYHDMNRRLLNDARFAQVMKVYNQHYRETDYPFLVKTLKKALEFKPDDAPTWVNLGKVFYLNGQRDSANVSWRKALQLDSANAEASRLLSTF